MAKMMKKKSPMKNMGKKKKMKSGNDPHAPKKMKMKKKKKR